MTQFDRLYSYWYRECGCVTRKHISSDVSVHRGLPEKWEVLTHCKTFKKHRWERCLTKVE